MMVELDDNRISDSVLRIVVMASGEGSNLQALIDAIESGQIENMRIEALLCDQPGAHCIERAIRHGIPSHILPAPQKLKRHSPERRCYDERLAAIADSYKPDFIFLLGWMRLLGQTFLENFPRKVINLHPALPGTFPGTNAIERAFEAFNQGKITNTGVMLHLVPDEGIDSGPVLSVAEIPIHKSDTLSILEERIHKIEHLEIVKLAQRLAHNRSLEEIQGREMQEALRTQDAQETQEAQETQHQDISREKESEHASRIDIGI